LTCIVLAVALTSCMNVRQEYSALMSEGKTRNVPLLIFATSWNDPHALYNSRMLVGLLNTGDRQIKSVVLHTADCGSKGITDDTQTLDLGGPFLPGKSYAIRPSWPVQYSQWISRERAEAAAKTSSHIVITAIDIIDSSGSKSVYVKDVSELLTSNISNFCLNSIY